MRLCRWATNSLRTLWESFFPPRREIPECLRPWLEELFPGLESDRIRFHDGLPDFINLGRLGGNPPAAITLPGVVGVCDVRVYFRDGVPDSCACAGLELIAHELVHVHQYRDWARGCGAGFARAFMLPYLLCAVRHGYDQHPMELEAEAFEGRVAGCCNGTRRPCDCTSGEPRPDPAGLSNWIANCGHVVFTGTAIGFWEHLWRCVPGSAGWWRRTGRVWRACGEFFRRRLREEAGRIDAGGVPSDASDITGGLRERLARLAHRIFAVWAQSVFVCIGTTLLAAVMAVVGIAWFVVAMAILLAVTLAIAVLWPIFKLVWLIVTGIWAVVVGVLCLLDLIWQAITWLWARIREGLTAACEWGERLERRCVRWEERRRRECAREEEERRRECAREEEERRRECAREEEERRRECAREEERRRRNCCDWAPCSWACKAWSWIVEKVCVAWNWVVEKICVAWNWVVEKVCVAWNWVVEKVCVAWTWVVSRTCRAFTWVVRGATCWARG